MGGAPTLLTRVAALVALLGALGAYYAGHESLPRISTWWDIALLAFALVPAVFALVLVVLPLRRAVGLLPVGIACLVLAWAFDKAGIPSAANFAKLGAMTTIAWWFLGWFESLSWVVLIAAIVPFVDAYSVWRGPTNHIVHHQRHLFTTLSFAFPVPGRYGSANLGLPDLLFFGLFLAAAARFGLRVWWTWLAMTLSFGATMALTVEFDLAGLPALPLLALGFLLPNVDLVWRELRRARTR